MRILIVGTHPQQLRMLQDIISTGTDLFVEVSTGPEDALVRSRKMFDLVLVECLNSSTDGLEFIEILRRREDYLVVPILATLAEHDRKTRLDAVKAGATDLLQIPVDAIDLMARVRSLLALRQAQLDLANRAAWLAREVSLATRELSEREEEFIWRLSRALEYRDGGMAGHISRVATVSQQIARGLGLSEDRCRMIYLAAPLHDIGKVAIPDAILGKPGRLDERETAIMRSHVEIGVRILADGSSDLIHTASRIASAHHERWDGGGYPDGIAGEAIPIEGRIAAVADVFDALCSERPYKQPWPVEQARQEILRNSGSHFDPACVDAFVDRWTQIETLYKPTAVYGHSKLATN